MSNQVPINPLAYAVAKWISMGLGSIILIILSKIIWDWLSGKSSRAPNQTCPLHDGIEGHCKQMEDSLMLVRTRYVDRDEHKDAMALLRDAMSGIDNKISGIKDDISDIRVEMAGLKKN